MKLDKVRSRLRGLIIKQTIGAVFVFAIIVALNGFVANHFSFSAPTVSAVILSVFAIIMLIGIVGQIVMVQTIDYSKPIAKIQQQLEVVKRHNLRFFRITMLSGPFYMAYIFLGVYLLSGINFYPRADSAWLTAQLLFSGAMLVGVLWFNYEIGQKPPRYRWARKIVESIGGKEVIDGMDFLQELKEFEQEY
jgi:MFS family permease